jgi:hypothetical protein
MRWCKILVSGEIPSYLVLGRVYSFKLNSVRTVRIFELSSDIVSSRTAYDEAQNPCPLEYC